MSRPRGLQPPTRATELPSVEEPQSSRAWITTDDHISYHAESSHAPQPITSQEPSWQYSLHSIMAPPVTYDGKPLPASSMPSDSESSRATGGYKNKDKNTEGEGNLPPEDDIVVPEYPHSAYNYGTWSAADDRTLVLARSRGKHWVELQRTYFPTKTANACRKRYERLMERRGALEQDSQRLERISYEYMALRKQMWTPLADRVGEKWEVVEAACMSAGIRTIQSNARSHTNRWRRESRASQKGREGPLGLPHDLNNTGMPTLASSGMEPINMTRDFGLPDSFQAPLGGGISNDPTPRTMHHQPAKDAGLMPPPPFPAPGSGALPTEGTAPSIPFAGYLHVKSTRRPVASRARTEVRSAGGELGWHISN
ncbi:hypothetical protein QBC41DRAFT_327827 [Cercophora samala]|uniref:Myb-like domain-containing protein n=1 Tax=Cercophora samala TaxID=330535 RepID=A0AA39Z752_9PEZI|nr:hypothetical protein QBC41DRAFT_327827 [Cercophora samala]